jgi:hypothetical protein
MIGSAHAEKLVALVICNGAYNDAPTPGVTRILSSFDDFEYASAVYTLHSASP